MQPRFLRRLEIFSLQLQPSRLLLFGADFGRRGGMAQARVAPQSFLARAARLDISRAKMRLRVFFVHVA